MRAPRGADRVADGDRAAVDVHAVLVDPEHADRVERHGGEGLVDLPQVDVARLQARLVERELARVGRRAGEVGEVVGDLRLGDDRAEDLLGVRLGPVLGREHERARAVVDARRVAGGVRALLRAQARQLGEALERGVAARRLVDLDGGVALLRGHRHGDHLLGQAAVVGRGDHALVRAQRPAVEVRAAQLELVADLGGLLEHLLAAEGVAQAVLDHPVEQLRVAHAEAEARLRQQVGGVGHRLHAAADRDLDVTGADRGVEDADRADARGAHLVDGLRGDLLGDAGLDLGLARGDLPLAGLEDLPHHDVLDLVRLDPGALEGRLDRDPPELRGLERGEAPAELADRGAGGAEDHGCWTCASTLVSALNGRPRHHRRPRSHRRRHHRGRRIRG